MFDHINEVMEEGLDTLANKIHVMVIEETVKLIKRWNNLIPDYEFQIGCHDLPNFRYRKIGKDKWQEMEIYRASNYKDDFKKICGEAEQFSKFYCGLDTRFCAYTFGWVGEKGEI